MISNKYFVAFDLGSSRISAMAAEVLDNGEIKILSEESQPSEDIKYGIVEHAGAASFKVTQLQKLLQNSSKIANVDVVSVSVGARTLKLVPVEMKEFIGKDKVVTEELLKSMKEKCRASFNQPNYTVFDVLPVSYLIDDVRVDYPVSRSGTQIVVNFNMAVGSAVINEKLNSCFDRTGWIFEHKPLAVEALSAVLLEDRDREDGCAIINFGASTTTLAAYYEGALQYLLVVPLGSKNITKDIQFLGISDLHAEKLKVLKGCALESMIVDPVYVQVPSVDDGAPSVKVSTQILATVIEARLDEMLQPIFSAIELLPFALDAGIVISGGGSKLTNLIDYIQDRTQIPTRFGNHADWLSEDTDPRFYDPQYSQLVGTIVLSNEYRKNTPVETTIKDPKKKPKIPGKIKEKVRLGFYNFFSDENSMN